MIAYILRRAAFLVLTLLLTSILVFAITQLLPGDVCRVILGREAGAAQIERCREGLHLDDPPVMRYLSWLGSYVSGDWGVSYSLDVDIRPLVERRLGNSLMLAGLTMLIALPLAVGLGALAGLNEGKFTDAVISVGALAVVGLPEFITGIALVQVFSFRLGWLPSTSLIEPGASFWQTLPGLVLPALTATLVLLAYLARLTRAGVIEQLKQTYVRTAVLKGLPRRVVLLRHVLRNALLPVITAAAISVGWLVSGLIVVENVFNYPGLGRLVVFAIERRDLPLLQATTMVAVVGFALANLAADLLYAWLNPRIRLGE